MKIMIIFSPTKLIPFRGWEAKEKHKKKKSAEELARKLRS